VILKEETPTNVCDELDLCTNGSVSIRNNIQQKEPTSSIGYFWQIADMHIDLQYVVGTDPLTRCTKGTPKEGTETRDCIGDIPSSPVDLDPR
jgi:hypothetical protein